jgi:hypothetical protein
MRAGAWVFAIENDAADGKLMIGAEATFDNMYVANCSNLLLQGKHENTFPYV